MDTQINEHLCPKWNYRKDCFILQCMNLSIRHSVESNILSITGAFDLSTTKDVRGASKVLQGLVSSDGIRLSASRIYRHSKGALGKGKKSKRRQHAYRERSIELLVPTLIFSVNLRFRVPNQVSQIVSETTGSSHVQGPYISSPKILSIIYMNLLKQFPQIISFMSFSRSY